MAKNYYNILEVDKNASADDIKKAFKKMALKYHPDKNQGDANAEAKFKEINEANSVLSDPEKKKMYDLTGSVGENPVYDHFRSQFDKFKQASGFGGGGGFGRQIRKGQPIQIVINMTLEEIYSGIKKTIRYKKTSNCKSCNGNGSKDGKSIDTCNVCKGAGTVGVQHGQWYVENSCHKCGGYGRIIKEECHQCGGSCVDNVDTELNIEMPSGVMDGWHTIVQGKGHDAINVPQGSIPGDLYIIVKQSHHNKFEREGNNIIYRLGINFTQAALGGKIEVPTVDGKALVFDLGECTQNGKILRLKDKGLPSFERRGDFGDMLVLIEIIIPTSLTTKEKELITKLSKETNFKIK